MILKHETIELYGNPLFTWVTIQAPLDGPVPLPSEACFVYFVDGGNEPLTENGELVAAPGQVILSLCGHTVGHMLSKPREVTFSSIIVHFQREHFLKVYANEKPPFWKEMETPLVQWIVQSAASELVKAFFAGVQHLFTHKEAVTEDILVLKLKEIILLLLQTPDSPSVTNLMRSLFSERTFSFKEIVDANICEPVTIEGLAARTNNSLSSFKREFKRIYNATPGTYIINKRAEKVASLLRISDESISTIGYQCGFSSPAHLSRVFKAKYGMTPSQYRLNASVK